MFGCRPVACLGSMSSSASAGTGSHHTTAWQWVALAVLSLSTFVVVTSEMLPVGVLTPMAEGLGVGSGTAGFSLTITGLVTAVTAPVVPRVLGGVDRRWVLAVSMVVLAAGNALTAVADGFGLLVVSRVILGLGMGAVWGLAAAVAPRLVGPRHAALAVSCAVSGVAAASVAGVPAGTVIGDAFGWRAAFVALAVSAVVLAAALLVTLPRLPRPRTGPAVGVPAGRSPLASRAVVGGLAVVVVLVTAHFAAYTYVRPTLEGHGMTAGGIAVALLVYGVFGLVGNFAAGALAAGRPRATVLLLAGGIAASVALLALSAGLTGVAGVAMGLWGLAYGGLSVAGQLWMQRSAPDRVEEVTGLYVGLFTAAIALGALLGGGLVGAVGIVPLLWSASCLALAALAIGLAGPRAVPPSGSGTDGNGSRMPAELANHPGTTGSRT